jgi:hypothetical protein
MGLPQASSGASWSHGPRVLARYRRAAETVEVPTPVPMARSHHEAGGESREDEGDNHCSTGPVPFQHHATVGPRFPCTSEQLAHQHTHTHHG